MNLFLPISAQRTKYRTFGQNFYFNLWRDPKKIRMSVATYESVDEKSLL